MREPLPNELERLDRAAESWVGTPFCANSAVKGAGVSCHRLVRALYSEAGWLELEGVPDGSPAHSRAGRTSPMNEWLVNHGRDYFAETTNGDIKPGDLLLIRFGATPHHLAVALSGGRVVHSIISHGVQILPVLPESYRRRVVGVFRPILP